MTVGEKIRHFRQKKGLTQKQLGELCEPKIAESTIRRYEIGNLNPKIETIQRIAKALKVAYTDLIDIESTEKEMDFFELYISYLQNIGCKITLYRNLVYGLEYKDKYVELSFDEFTSLSHDAVEHILLKLDSLIHTKGTLIAVDSHNNHANEPKVLEKMQEDIEEMKRQED